MFCGKCGTKIKEGDSFCTNCGAKILDVCNVKKEKRSKKIKEKQIEFEKGAIICFGRFVQNSKNLEPIEWQILDVQDKKMLLISKTCINAMPFNHKKSSNNKWTESEVREWLNNKFYNYAFSQFEQSAIIKTAVDDVEDSIFILGREETEQYNLKYISADVNKYVEVKGASWEDYENKKIDWFLRTEGDFDYIQTSCESRGHSCSETYGVRPSLWIDIDIYKESQNMNDKNKYVYCSSETKNDNQVDINKAAEGDIVLFGKYWQGLSKDEGKSTIEWIVLERQSDKMLLISKNILDRKAYNDFEEETKEEACTWEKSSLRKWLNNVFIDDAFGKPQFKKIIESKISNNDYNETLDKIFLLDENEYNKYKSILKKHETEPTEFAIKKTVYDNEYILRTIKNEYNFQYACVAFHDEYDGESYRTGDTLFYDEYGIRPAMWVKI